MNADVRNWYHKQSICFYNRSDYEKTAITMVTKLQNSQISLDANFITNH